MQAILDELVKSYPKDTLLNQVFLPLVHARAEMRRGKPLAHQDCGARQPQKAYQSFFALKDADPDIPVLQEARREHARLREAIALSRASGLTTSLRLS